MSHLTRQGGRWSLSRRTLLRGALGGGAVRLGLPLLGSMLAPSGAALADGEALPRRFGVFFFGNGVRLDRWVPSGVGVGDAWELPPSLDPLRAYKDVLTVVSGFDVPFFGLAPHGVGGSAMLCGTTLREPFAYLEALGASVDQIVAAAIGGATPYPSIVTASHEANGRSFTGPLRHNPPHRRPIDLYERVFGSTFRLPGQAADPRLGWRRSVLDAVLGDLTSLSAEVGAEDRRRLAQHADGVRALELRLARLEEEVIVRAGCVQPTSPDPTMGNPWASPEDAALVNGVFADLMAMAMACDLTRVFHHGFCEPEGGTLFPGIPESHHLLTHNEPGDQPMVAEVVLQIMEGLASWARALDALPEGDGTLLDRSVIYATSEVAEGVTHSIRDMPVLFVGDAGGALRANQHLRGTGESTSHIPLTLLHAMGVTSATFGMDEGYVSEPLGALLT